MVKWLVGVFLFLCGVEDVRRKQIYVCPVVVVSAVVVLYHLFRGDASVWNCAGGLAVGGAVLVLSLLSRGQIGLGDALLFCLTGLTVGFGGNIRILCYSFLFVGLVSGYLLFVRHKNKRHTIPFVPYLFMGYCLVAAYGG